MLYRSLGLLSIQKKYLVTFEPVVGTVDSGHFVYVGRDPLGGGADRDQRASGADGVGSARVGAGSDYGGGDLELGSSGRADAASHAGRLTGSGHLSGDQS